MAGIAKSGWWGVVLDAPDAPALARFYAHILGWPVASEEPGWATITQPETTSYIAFASAEGYVPPVWPREEGAQQMMMHLDIGVSDLEAAVADAVEHGASIASYQPQETVRVMLDPAGHPFCLYLDV